MLLCLCRRSLLDADHAQDWPAGAELNMGANSYLNGRTNSLSVNKRAEPGVRIDDQAAPFAKPKLGVLARHHRELVLRKEVIADGRVASDQHQFAGERTLSLQLAAAIFCQNDFHKLGDLECGDLSPLSCRE